MKKAFCCSLVLLCAACSASQEPVIGTSPSKHSAQFSSSATSVRIEWKIDLVAQDLAVPWDIAIAPDQSLFVTERAGNLKRISGTSVQDIGGLPAVVSSGESGLTGIELSPDFVDDGGVYLYYSYRSSNGLKNRVSLFTLGGTELRDERVIVDGLPGGFIHNGGRLRFGPDGKLWILTGDGADTSTPQEMQSLGGKVLRMNADGSIPSDNPFAGSAVYSLGHRNPQGLDWDPVSGSLLVSEHGNSAHDEVNVIEAGKNYGWPTDRTCDSDRDDFTDPLLCSGTITWAPSGLAFLRTSDPALKGSFLLAGLRGSFVKRYVFEQGKVMEKEMILGQKYGRLRGVTAAKDGSVYVTTSNRDGRGRVRGGDDKIIKVTPIRVGDI